MCISPFFILYTRLLSGSICLALLVKSPSSLVLDTVFLSGKWRFPTLLCFRCKVLIRSKHYNQCRSKPWVLGVAAQGPRPAGERGGGSEKKLVEQVSPNMMLLGVEGSQNQWPTQLKNRWPRASTVSWRWPSSEKNSIERQTMGIHQVLVAFSFSLSLSPSPPLSQSRCLCLSV